MKTIFPNQPQNLALDPYLSLDNLESIADSLVIVAGMPTEDAKTALEELRSVRRRDALGQASLLLKTRDRTAYDRIFELVLRLGKNQGVAA